MGTLLQLCTTVPLRADAERIADALLEARLAACVQIEGPLQSRYHWQGVRTVSVEYRLWAKVVERTRSRAEAMILQEHPYGVPELIAIPANGVSEAYFDWVQGECDG